MRVKRVCVWVAGLMFVTGVFSSRAAELAGQFLDEKVWASKAESLKIGAPQPGGKGVKTTVFGVSPVNVSVFPNVAPVSKVTLTYVDASQYLDQSWRQKEYTDTRGMDEGERRRRMKELEKEVEEGREAFKKQKEELPGLVEDTGRLLVRELERWTKDPGKSIKADPVGNIERVYHYGKFEIRLFVLAERLVQVVIHHTELADAKKEPPAVDKKRVMTSENGDVKLRSFPAMSTGNNGYSYPRCLDMICRYMGRNVDVNLLVAQSRFQEEKRGNKNVAGLNRKISQEAKVKLQMEPRATLAVVKREIDKGQPLLVTRYYTTERDAFHTKYAGDFRKARDKKFPQPEELRSAKLFPSKFRHGTLSSVIVGYNEEREEILFLNGISEDGAGEKRMSAKELTATTQQLYKTSLRAGAGGGSSEGTVTPAGGEVKRVW